MKTIYILIIGLISIITVFGQEKCPAEDIEKENIELAKDIFSSETEEQRINGNSYVCELSAMTDERFNALCDRFEYNPNLEKAKKNNPNLSDYVMYAKNFNGEINLYSAILDNYRKEIENLPQDAKKRLEVINNTIKMYQDLQHALDREISYNTGEIIDNGTNLAIKHIKIFPQNTDNMGIVDLAKNARMLELNNDIKNLIGKEIVKEIKKEITYEIAKKSPPINNEVADGMNAAFKLVDRAAIIAPPLKVITTAPLYKVFKSLPEVGKMLGHAGAVVNIYFRKNEYEKLITELEREKFYILDNKQLGTVIKSVR